MKPHPQLNNAGSLHEEVLGSRLDAFNQTVSTFAKNSHLMSSTADSVASRISCCDDLDTSRAKSFIYILKIV